MRVPVTPDRRGRLLRTSGIVRPTVGAIAVVVAAMLSGCGSSSATVAEVYVVENGRAVDVIVNTCHADLDIDVDETPESITITASRRDREFFGGDDCADMVRVVLEDPVGSRRFLTSGGRELPVVAAADPTASSDVTTSTPACDDPPPQVELVTAGTVIPMDFLYVDRFCGYHGDGAAMLDSAYRPPVFPAAPGRLTITGLPGSAEVTADIRPLNDAISLATIRPTNTIAPSDDGVYSVDFDEAGCSAISVAWSTPDGRGQHVALVAPPGIDCPPASI